jgi:hypothetical protein
VLGCTARTIGEAALTVTGSAASATNTVTVEVA